MKTLLISFKSFIVLVGILFFQMNCGIHSRINYDGQQKSSVFMTGLDVLAENNFLQLRGKRVGLITNQTGLDKNLVQNIDIFIESENVDLKAIFSPEHGLFGSIAAGKKIISGNDSISDIPIVSLYGKTRKPSKSMLKNLDILVFDIQDIGVRSYTYISTMGLAMEAAAGQGLEFMVLDRPNPMGLKKIEGNVLEMQFKSFIGQYPIPYVYGLTCGELATMINERGWLEAGKCDLRVIKMKNFSREHAYEELGLRWVPTSPHVPIFTTPTYMVATGILGELGVFSNGVGYTTPFMTIAAPWINAEEIAEKMNALNLKGVVFRPLKYKPYYAVHKGDDIGGVQIYVNDRDKADLISIQFYFLQEHHSLYPDKDPFQMATDQQLQMFDKALGTDNIRINFSKTFKVADIQDDLVFGLDDYRNFVSQYHIYD